MRGTMRRNLVHLCTALLIGIGLPTVGCGSSGDVGATSGYTTVGDTVEAGGLSTAGSDAGAQNDAASDAGTAAQDATQDTAGTDVVETDAGASDSASADAGGTVDAGTVDAGTVDAGTVDAGTVDAGTVDAGSVDAGSADAGQVDTGGTTGVCAQKVQTFNPVAAEASKCQSDLDCYGPADFIEGKGWAFGAEAQLGCKCPKVYNGNSPKSQAVADLVGEYHKAGCPDTCPDSDCAGLGNTIGVCEAGVCVPKSFTCKELEARSVQVVAAGRACTADAECSSFGMQGELPCGCGVNVNLGLMAPGQPIFLYMTRLSQVYVAMGCADLVECACPTIGKGVCKSGLCTSQ